MSSKSAVKNSIRKYESLDKALTLYKGFRGRIPVPDMEFPELIGMELSSVCNLSCTHCPPQTIHSGLKKGMLDYDLFLKIIDEIDTRGACKIALHKDGEPLLYPRIIDVLNRVKKYNSHEVYLSTNAHLLNNEISKTILDNHIDVVNFSIGAATESFYSKVRGKCFSIVINKIINFISMAKTAIKPPRIFVQIINLPEYPEMSEEILLFKKFWSKYDVSIAVCEKLSWGLYDIPKKSSYRYPCFSLWSSLFINSDGTASACCMDWTHQLIVGDTAKNTLNEIWASQELNALRIEHIQKKEKEMKMCDKCNYWFLQPRLLDYPLHDWN